MVADENLGLRKKITEAEAQIEALKRDANFTISPFEDGKLN